MSASYGDVLAGMPNQTTIGGESLAKLQQTNPVGYAYYRSLSPQQLQLLQQSAAYNAANPNQRGANARDGQEANQYDLAFQKTLTPQQAQLNSIMGQGATTDASGKVTYGVLAPETGIDKVLNEVAPIATMALGAAAFAPAIAGLTGLSSGVSTALASGGLNTAKTAVMGGNVGQALESGAISAGLAGLGGPLSELNSGVGNVVSNVAGDTIGNVAGDVAQGAVTGAIGSGLKGGNIGTGAVAGGLGGGASGEIADVTGSNAAGNIGGGIVGSEIGSSLSNTQKGTKPSTISPTTGAGYGNALSGLPPGAIKPTNKETAVPTPADNSVANAANAAAGATPPPSGSSSSGLGDIFSGVGNLLGNSGGVLAGAGLGLYEANQAKSDAATQANTLKGLGAPYVDAGKNMLNQATSGTLTPAQQAQINSLTGQGNTLIGQANPEITGGTDAIKAANAGQLPSWQQAQIDQQTAQAKAQIAQQLGSSVNSSVLQQYYNQIDQNAAITKGQMIQSNLSAGQNELAAGTTLEQQGQTDIGAAKEAAVADTEQAFKDAMSLAAAGNGPIQDAVNMLIASDANISNSLMQFMGELAKSYSSGGGGQNAGGGAGNALQSIGSGIGKLFGSGGGGGASSPAATDANMAGSMAGDITKPGSTPIDTQDYLAANPFPTDGLPNLDSIDGGTSGVDDILNTYNTPTIDIPGG